MDFNIHTNYALGERVWFTHQRTGDSVLGMVYAIQYYIGPNSREEITYTIVEDGINRKHFVRAELVHKAWETHPNREIKEKQSFIHKLLSR